MGENYHYLDHHHRRQPEEKPAKPSRLGLRGGSGGGGGGEIVEVQGGHIVRSTGRKDRHSKVCTAKGPRDRRVRLSAHTAIQFYDVQDRLGYDRPSKAVDWLINKAKAAIDELAELPAWKPTADLRTRTILNFEHNPDDEIVDNQMGNNQNLNFLPQSLDSIKSFFPMGGSSAPVTENNSSGMQFHHSFTQNQDLKLSLQSFEDPILQHHHQQPPPLPSHYFDGSGWPENGGFQRMMGWGGGGNGNGNENENGDTVSNGFMFSSVSPPPPPPTQTPPFLQPLFGQTTNNQLFNYISQRGPLQSSNTPPVRAWVDHPSQFSGAGIDPHQTLGFHHPFSMPGFTSMMNPGMSGYPGFHIPARIQGEEEDHDGLSDKPSSASSDSRH